MHNLIPRNQLAEWDHFNSLGYDIDEIDLVNDYFDCLIECDSTQGTCKRICRSLFG